MNIFNTPLWIKNIEFDNAKLEEEIYNFSKNEPNHPYSTNGGYQRDLFYNKRNHRCHS